MTKIWYSVEKTYINTAGHAGGGEPGHDIICAGVSAIMHALLNSLMEEADREHMKVTWIMEPGKMLINTQVESKYYKERAKDYYRMAVIGLMAVAENYPGNIEIKEV